jgi:hypothetical protein
MFIAKKKDIGICDSEQQITVNIIFWVVVFRSVVSPALNIMVIQHYLSVFVKKNKKNKGI